jgi:hypothetical protein
VRWSWKQWGWRSIQLNEFSIYQERHKCCDAEYMG